ncbi:glycerophosphodiester phosphodiesterase family protein [Falsirhodobacter sp. 20TX0035]|uniref:glycerophosphodiester phosphodiesterase family protein n=1 Tax=Falsirhodobacter sp. 20TX0035 TaxID=3022019 RepID=UPI00232BE02F|nr:glycerophosphodiester phosphodiesterase family protein [Falsirhodobacter sp. 20TX0035]MDB6454009.1 glycerophosphodiester phosphodiesterase family protein [Falsirhodobacter sp. 20TX0035]
MLPPDFLRLPVAHRALHDRAAGRIENSRAAIRAAIAAGYAIEIDLQLSSDGVPVVFHDDDLDRLTDRTGPVAARTAQDLSAIPLIGGDETIPTFAEVLEIVAGQVPLLVEIKDQTPFTGDLERATAALLKGYDGPVAVMGFNPETVVRMAELAPGIPRGLTTCDYSAEDWPHLDEAERARLRDIPDYDRAGASFLSHYHRDLDRPRVAELKAQGAAILCWTIRTPEEEREARRVAANVTFESYPAPIPA